MLNVKSNQINSETINLNNLFFVQRDIRATQLKLFQKVSIMINKAGFLKLKHHKFTVILKLQISTAQYLKTKIKKIKKIF